MTEAEELELLELEEWEASQAGPAPSAPARREQGALDKTIGALQSVNQGVFAGWGDEIAAVGRAALPDPAYDFGEGVSMEKQSFGDAVSMYKDADERNRKQFAEENPKTALATEVGGALLSPINKVAPNLGGTNRWARTAANVMRGGAEGALVGAGVSEEGERLSGAGKGAGFGAGASAGLSGLGALGRTVASQKVSKDIAKKVVDASGKAKEIIKPLNMSDPDSILGKFYRNYVGNSIGGRGTVGRQESQWLNAHPKLQRFADDAGQVVPVKAGTAKAVKEVKKRAADQAKTAQNSSARRVAALASEGDEAVDIANREGVETLIDNATPSSAVADNALPSPPGTPKGTDVDRIRGLDEWWTKNGFEMVKERPFKLDNSLGDDIQRMIDGDPDLTLALGEVMPQLQKLQTKLGGGPIDMTDFMASLRAGSKEVAPRGAETAQRAAGDLPEYLIDGDALMAMRNVFATGANGRSKNAWALREVAQKFDAMIRKQLMDVDPKAAAQFDEHLGSYATKVGLSKAATQARKASKRMITPKDVNKKLSNTSGGRAASDVAQAAVDAGDAGKAQAKKAAGLEKNRSRRLKQAATAAQNRIDRETRGILPEDQTGWSQVATTFILGLGNPIQGAATAKALGQGGLQKAMAGQAGWQKAAQKLAATEQAQLVKLLVSRGMPRELAMRQVEGE